MNKWINASLLKIMMNEWMYECILTEDNDEWMNECMHASLQKIMTGWNFQEGSMNELGWLPSYTENNDWDEYKDQMNERMIASLQNND